jgi:hypothetical protein
MGNGFEGCQTMIEKPDPNHLCDNFGTAYDYNDEMCRGCDNFVFCMEMK